MDVYKYYYYLCWAGLRHPKYIKKFKEWMVVNKNNPKIKKLIAGVGFELVKRP